MSRTSSISDGVKVSARSRRLNHRKLAFEPLEDRRVLGAYGALSAGPDFLQAAPSPPILTDLGDYAALADADPAIEITALPPYGVDGLLRGTVRGVDFRTHRVATYIQVEGAGWWTKPTFDDPATEINLDGSFSVDVVTGGNDAWATIFCVALVPALEDDEGYPQAHGEGWVPPELDSLALATDYRERYGRELEFAGYTWAIKDAPEEPAGPGPNYFSSRASDAWVDQDGLHLTVSFRERSWWSTEVMLMDHLGYGTYAFQTNSRNNMLDANAVFGAYTWDGYGDDDAMPAWPHREIDFEDSRWGNAADPTNAQMVVQPWNEPGHLRRYTIPDLGADPAMTRFFIWEPHQIEFVALTGHHTPYDYTEGDIIDRWVFPHDPPGRIVPEPGREQFRFNLYLNGGTAPAVGLPIEEVISDFAYYPSLGTVDFLALEDLDPSAGDLRYRFQTAREGLLTAVASAGDGSGDVELTLLDENLGELVSSSLVDGDERIDHATLSGVTYYLRVHGEAADVDLRLANLVRQVGPNVTVYGTAGDDQFRFEPATPRPVAINGIRYKFDEAAPTSFTFDGAAGAYGGYDVAKLYDSPGDDTFIVTPDEASSSGPGYSSRVVGVDLALGVAKYGGYDVAKLYDSPGDDAFVGTPTYSKMSTGDATYAYAKSFEHVIGYSRAGSDTAVLKDSPGDDKFVGRSTYAKLSGPGFKVQAQWFDAVEAYAWYGGNDRAYLFDSPGDDYFFGTPVDARMVGSGFRNYAKRFEWAYGYGTAGGMDRAIFYDSPGDDVFVGAATRGRLTGPGYFLQAVRCDVVRAFSGSGGQDKARLFDSDGDDVLVATPEYSYLRGSSSSGPFKNRADGFAEIEATARYGGNDTARIYDSALNDYLHAEGNSAVITWDAARVLAAYDFEQVEADGTKGGVNELKKVLPIDYLLLTTGDWTEL